MLLIFRWKKDNHIHHYLCHRIQQQQIRRSRLTGSGDICLTMIYLAFNSWFDRKKLLIFLDGKF